MAVFSNVFFKVRDFRKTQISVAISIDLELQLDRSSAQSLGISSSGGGCGLAESLDDVVAGGELLFRRNFHGNFRISEWRKG